MELVDLSSADHRGPIAKIRDLARWPHHCRPTKRALQDLIALGLTKEDALEGVLEHLKCGSAVHAIKQEQSGLTAYVFLPCIVQSWRLYVKVQVPPAASEMKEQLILISAHVPEFPVKERTK